jgi:hypothetical protein
VAGDAFRLDATASPVDLSSSGRSDLAVEFSVCRTHGRSLLGAAPAELLGEVPDRWVVATEARDHA